MLNPTDTTTDETEALFRQLQALEERADDIQRNSQSVFNYFRGTTPETNAQAVALEGSEDGTILMVLHEYGEEFEGKIQGEIFVKFPEGFYTI